MLEHYHSLNTDEHNCPECGSHTYEIQEGSRWIKVGACVFRSWSGARVLDGKPYNGPHYFWLSEEAAPDVRIENHGSLTLLRPLSDRGRGWLYDAERFSPDTMRFNGAIVVEPRYVEPIAEGMIDDGLILQ